jgi:hypothetical protein
MAHRSAACQVVAMKTFRPSWLRQGLVASIIGLSATVSVPVRAQDSTAATPAAQAPRPVLVWLSGGLGPAYYRNSDAIALRGSVSFSYGRAVLVARATDAFDGIDGYTSTKESSVLGGLRVGGPHLYLITAVGAAKVRWEDNSCSSFSCGPGVPPVDELDRMGMAYDVGVHLGKWIAGLAVNLSGVTGPSRGRLTAFTVSIELGWFGR